MSDHESRRPNPPALVASNGRRFAAIASAVFAFIVDPGSRRFLLLSSPQKRGRGGWEVPGGAVEEGETLLQALDREVAEEVGRSVRFRVLGTVHAWSFRYDAAVPNLTSTAFVASYEGGDVVPGEEMAGCEVRWASLEEVVAFGREVGAVVPEPWMFERALQCFDLWEPEGGRARRGWETGI